MELVKNIFFNTDKLVENTKVKISYAGQLFQDGSEEVYIHYGFGLNWDNLGEVKMEKTELGFQAEIELLSDDTFNFCFRDGENKWDNNNCENYVFPIEKVELAIVPQEESQLSVRRLRRSYIWGKKVKLTIYKVITYLPKLIAGNYKRKITNE